MEKITLSWLAKTLRPYTKEPSQAYRKMLNSFFDAVLGIDRSDSGINAEYDKAACSRIMNGEYDVPYVVREKANEQSEREKLEIRMKKYFDSNINHSLEDDFRSKASDCIRKSSLSEFLKNEVCSIKKADDLFLLLAIYALQTDNRFDNSALLYRNGELEISLMHGDIISKIFNKKETQRAKYFAIPVDRRYTFEMRNFGVGDRNPEIMNPIHGRLDKRLRLLGMEEGPFAEVADDMNDPYHICIFSYNHHRIYLTPVYEQREGKELLDFRMFEKCMGYVARDYCWEQGNGPLLIPLFGFEEHGFFRSGFSCFYHTARHFVGRKDLIGKIYFVIDDRKEFLRLSAMAQKHDTETIWWEE